MSDGDVPGRRALLLLGSATAVAALPACVFDTSGPFVEVAQFFDGCFAGTTPQPTTLSLVKEKRNLMRGTLTRGEGDSVLVYALQGKAKSDDLAVFTGSLSESPDARVVVLRSLAGVLTARINDGPPLGPLEPCA